MNMGNNGEKKLSYRENNNAVNDCGRNKARLWIEKSRHWLGNENPAWSYAPAKAAQLRVSKNCCKAGQKICE